MLSRFDDANISGASRLVIKSVLLGGVGWLRGGRSVRSIERFGEWRLRDGDAPFDDGGVDTSIAVAAIGSRMVVEMLRCW